MLGPVKGCRPDGTIDDQTIYDQSDTPENPSPHNVIVVAEIEEKWVIVIIACAHGLNIRNNRNG